MRLQAGLSNLGGPCFSIDTTKQLHPPRDFPIGSPQEQLMISSSSRQLCFSIVRRYHCPHGQRKVALWSSLEQAASGSAAIPMGLLSSSRSLGKRLSCSGALSSSTKGVPHPRVFLVTFRDTDRPCAWPGAPEAHLPPGLCSHALRPTTTPFPPALPPDCLV